MKKKIIIITLILIISISIVKLYQTYAISSSVIGNNDNYTVNLNGNTSVVVPANGNKTVYYKIRNANNGTVQYSVGYKSTNTIVKVYSDSDNNATGLIDKEENKFIKLYLENSSSSSETVYLTTVLGYEFGEKLIVPTGYKIVSSKYNKYKGSAKKIADLFDNSIKKELINNNITYIYDEEDNLIEDVDGNLRYYGASPNNYIYFNCFDYNNQNDTTCEKWRIIGIVDGKLKIMRNEIIGEYSYDNKNESTGASSDSGSNDWTNARLMKLLNPSSYYTLDNNDNGNGQSLYWNSEAGTCFAGKNNSTTHCDFTNTGIKNDITRAMISETIHSLKSYKKIPVNVSIYSDEMYHYERYGGTMNDITKNKTWTGKIAVPYPSDYGYAADFKSCQVALKDYDSCSNNNWIFPICSSYYTWLLTPSTRNDATSFTVFRYRPPVQGHWVNSPGSIIDGFVAYSAWGVIPTLYLDSNYDISAGNGTSDNPYQLKIENNQQYTITYNANGGSGAPSNQTKKHGENITLSSVKPTKTGYTFNGWNTSSNGSGTSYSSGGTYSNNSDVTLYAQWQSVSNYTVTVYLQGELINNYTVVPGNNLNDRFVVSSEEEIRYKTCTNGATINATIGRSNNMTVATINVTNITSDTVCNLYYTLI